MALKSRWGGRLAGPLLLLLSLLLSLVLAEGFLRLALNPGDYLSVELVPDEVLKHRVKPHSAGHDAWGFRNPEVPGSADILALGDSQTYGVAAPGTRSWPAQLQRLTGRRVYNLALGGYGPAQYAHLLETRGLTLHPSVVILGFYFGNDLGDAFEMVYRYPAWAHLRDPAFTPAPPDTTAEAPHFLQGPRLWLGRHSVLYRLFSFHLAGQLRFLEMKLRGSADQALVVDDKTVGIRTGFTPAMRLEVLDTSIPEIAEGWRLTQGFLDRIAGVCRNHGVRLVVLLIPTKESVYAAGLPGVVPARHEAFPALIAAEEAVRRAVVARCDSLGLPWVDPLPEMAAAVRRGEAIYPSNQDGHPNGKGYAIIAGELAKRLGGIAETSTISP
ncbi:MAG: hypothetical protein C4524_10230 [Candidatus Zixiibacteriota bacterium]|nr:MAG: hypothetical protein C4524_10230 [candidate division Zixibacteria bacterium]